MQQPDQEPGLARGLRGLMMLGDCGTLSACELAQLLCVAPGSARDLLEAFEEYGFAIRIASSDRFVATGMTLRLSRSAVERNLDGFGWSPRPAQHGIFSGVVFH